MRTDWPRGAEDRLFLTPIGGQRLQAAEDIGNGSDTAPRWREVALPGEMADWSKTQEPLQGCGCHR